MVMCHMTADTLDELHAMARQLGLKPEWFQDGRFPHYDVSESKRKRAVQLGAIEETARQGVMRMMAAREKNS
jgi:hypothetical protein